MKGSDFAYDSVNLLHYKFHRISLNRGGSYIDSLKWLKNKKATINPKNNNDKCFQYAITAAFIDQYDWKEINFPSNNKDCNEFEKNNKTIALNILYVPHNTEEIRHAYKSKYNLNCENQVILLMITDGKKWYYLAVKSFPALIKGIISKHDRDFYLNLKSIQMYVKIITIVM